MNAAGTQACVPIRVRICLISPCKHSLSGGAIYTTKADQIPANTRKSPVITSTLDSNLDEAPQDNGYKFRMTNATMLLLFAKPDKAAHEGFHQDPQ